MDRRNANPTRGIILAAHGAGDDSPANALVRGFAARLAGEHDVEAVPAFQLGTPAFAAALDHLGDAVADVTVVPVMTSEGWYVRTVLPRELARSPRLDAVRLRYTVPVGLHPAVADVVADSADRACATARLDPAATALVVVGHGTQRSPHSRHATLQMCRDVREVTAFRRVVPAFLEEPPHVQDLPAHVAELNLVAIAFLIGGGGHALGDIPRRLGAVPANGTRACPQEFTLPDGRRCVLAGALADHPALFEIVRALAVPDGRDAHDLKQWHMGLKPCNTSAHGSKQRHALKPWHAAADTEDRA